MAAGIIVGGRTFPLTGFQGIPIPVLNWVDHGLQFRAGEGYNRKRREEISKIVWHWTGGEGPPDRMYRTLEKRKLGVSFAIGRNAIWQFADPLDVAPAAVGRWNQVSCSIEIVSYGFRRMKPWEWNIKEGNLLRVPRKGRERMTYDTVIHGRKVRVAHFTPYQTTMAKHLADVLSVALQIPRRVAPTKHRGVYDQAEGFDGHLGHFELPPRPGRKPRKLDPGPFFMSSVLGAHFSNNPTRSS